MNVLKIENKKHIVYIGDTHGNVQECLDKQFARGITDALFILLGDNGCGFTHFGIDIWDDKNREEWSKQLEDYRCELVALRGNHDNPEYFKHINTVGVTHLIPDYTVIECAGKNILVIGGGISIDRSNRRQGISYWANEITPYDEFQLEQIIDSYDEIHTVCTHDAPTFCKPEEVGKMVLSWCFWDKDLLEDVETNRTKLTDIYYKLATVYSHSLRTWYYGHFHNDYKTSFGKVWFFGMGIMSVITESIDHVYDGNESTEVD